MKSPRFRTCTLGRSSRKGVALILVLSALVLITALVIGLMARALAERKSAASYGAVASTRQLSDTVVNLVQAQINDATTQGATNAWASQPGALRLFDSSGSLLRIYKLYSAGSLTASNSASLSNDIPDGTWTNAPALWVDLNAPVSYSTSSGTNQAFPILDPRYIVSGPDAVTGFALNSPPGTNAVQPAPMPVRWLYILQDGKVIAPDAGSTTVATFASSSAQPSQQNPIVGRVAFWTDDDSCKVNINTAGDGTFWDTPRFGLDDTSRAADERIRAKFQPAQGEFQAYPGHPATTTLTNIFPGLGTNVFNVVPRYTYGGSRGGTTSASTNIPWKNARLYSSVGELLFSTNTTGPARQTNGLTRQQLENTRFFLTARSRSPEVNLFGKPRVAIWPLHANTNATYRTPTDRLIAFCSTINGRPYYFTRSNPQSATADIGLQRNGELLGYLDGLASTPVPGFGGNFNTKYAGGQRQILTQIFDYIRITNLRDALLPVANRYSVAGTTGGIGQVIPSHKSTTGWNTRGFGRFPVLYEANMLLMGMAKGKVGGTGEIPADTRQIPGYTDGTVFSGTGYSHPGNVPPDDTTAVQAFFLLNFFNPAYGWTAMDPGFVIRIRGLNGLTLGGLDMEFPSDDEMWSANVGLGGWYHGRGYSLVDMRYMITWPWYQGGRKLAKNNTLDRSKTLPFYSKILTIPNGTMALGGGSVEVLIYSGTSSATGELIQKYTLAIPNTTLPVPKVVPHNGSTPWLFCAKLNTDSGFSENDRVWCWWYDKTFEWVYNQDYDTILSMVPTGGIWSDYRTFALADPNTTGVPAAAFDVHPDTATNPGNAYGLRTGRTAWWGGSGSRPDPISGMLVQGFKDTGKWWDNIVTARLNGAFAGNVAGVPGDWDNAQAFENASAYINKADEGTIRGIQTTGTTPYFDETEQLVETGPTFFSPNRQIPSPVMFGSLPTEGSGASPKPWQTLLFRPGPTGHKGSVTPKDHLLLDLFWMPVAEPYAISEPLSTAGKVNMNYQIQPFTYITRNVGLRSVLLNEKVAMVPKDIGATARYSLNLSDTDGTLRQFRERFAAGDIFRSATEICDIFVVPSGKSWGTDAAALSDLYNSDYNTAPFVRVGDNVRERPYVNIYPRLTTKSNVYTVHYTVQALQNPTAANPAQWGANGAISGEYRGSTTLERYIDPNNADIPDYPTTTDPNPLTLDSFYRWRIIENTQFAP